VHDYDNASTSLLWMPLVAPLDPPPPPAPKKPSPHSNNPAELQKLSNYSGTWKTSSQSNDFTAIESEFRVKVSETDHFRIIQTQPLDGGTSARRLADRFKRGVQRPQKVIVPLLSPRIVQRHNFCGRRVCPVNVIQFGTIANWTCVGQVLQCRRPAPAERVNVIQLKPANLKSAGQQAILAPFASSLNDSPAD